MFLALGVQRQLDLYNSESKRHTMSYDSDNTNNLDNSGQKPSPIKKQKEKVK